MKGAACRSLTAELFDIVRMAVGYRRTMPDHLLTQIVPHMPSGDMIAIDDLISCLLDTDGLHDDLADHLEGAIATIRSCIAAGTERRDVPIPPERLIGCDAAHDIVDVLSPDAEALRAALPAVEALSRATRHALDFAEGVRVSRQMLSAE
ncbi:hypothetical protein SAMN05444339_12325 [Loktanella atrilutea]|uniref:Uncharacterized protein n=1 Tax=Loktanella atrilutea TaxID=366533 RepID=A0A1M5FPZ1_LOKAT|nr:hypothetical protein [Loktanella atrilutea]SHF93568.1 hypothetical protein SAMN05444339_12325 [Loktanella atrilutea]